MELTATAMRRVFWRFRPLFAQWAASHIVLLRAIRPALERAATKLAALEAIEG